MAGPNPFENLVVPLVQQGTSALNDAHSKVLAHAAAAAPTHKITVDDTSSRDGFHDILHNTLSVYDEKGNTLEVYQENDGGKFVDKKLGRANQPPEYTLRDAHGHQTKLDPKVGDMAMEVIKHLQSTSAPTVLPGESAYTSPKTLPQIISDAAATVKAQSKPGR